MINLKREKWNATGAWYWKGLTTRTLAFKRQKCAPGYKSSKECLMVMCCGNAFRSHKLNLVVGFEVLTVVSTKIAVFWVVVQCSLVNFYQTTWCYNPEDSHFLIL
jgi:hypothetical protein